MNMLYDDIFTCYLENCKILNSNIPTTNEGKYSMIHNACMHYGNRMDEIIEWDDTTETVSINTGLDKDNNRLLILAYCLKLIYHENSLTEFTDVFSTFQKELGISNYQAQVKARESNIIRTEQKIDELITNIEDGSIM